MSTRLKMHRKSAFLWRYFSLQRERIKLSPSLYFRQSNPVRWCGADAALRIDGDIGACLWRLQPIRPSTLTIRQDEGRKVFGRTSKGKHLSLTNITNCNLLVMQAAISCNQLQSVLNSFRRDDKLWKSAPSLLHISFRYTSVCSSFYVM